jgi:hypothetical protein
VKRNWDLVRHILLTIEELPWHNSHTDIHERMESSNDIDATPEEINYHLHVLYKNGLIDGMIRGAFGDTPGVPNQNITMTLAGHERLDTIRPETVWAKTKSVAAQTGDSTINAIFDIAKHIAKEGFSKFLSAGA